MQRRLEKAKIIMLCATYYSLKGGKTILESMAYILIGVIGNLDHITYEYTVDGTPHSLSVTAKAADSFFGRSIKDCGKSARILNELILKTGF